MGGQATIEQRVGLVAGRSMKAMLILRLLSIQGALNESIEHAVNFMF